jgi:hypothetical protein
MPGSRPAYHLRLGLARPAPHALARLLQLGDGHSELGDHTSICLIGSGCSWLRSGESGPAERGPESGEWGDPRGGMIPFPNQSDFVM